jgi:hypothetical protein
MSLNLEKYVTFKKDQQIKKKECYKNILEQVSNMIMNSMDSLIDHINYEIPPFIFGELEYEPLESVHYVIRKLKHNKSFKKIITKMDFYEPNILYIQWDMSKI